MNVTNDIRYIGVNDHQVDLFEGHFDVPLGMAYNSYVILDRKLAVMDTVDQNSAASGSPIWPPSSRAASPTTWWSSTWSPTTAPTSSSLWRPIPRPPW